MSEELQRELAAARARVAELEAKAAAETRTAVKRPEPSADGLSKLAVVGLLAVGAILVVLVFTSGAPKPEPADSTANVTVAAVPQAEINESAKGAWDYRTIPDEMRDKPTLMACKTSDTPVRLEWPYETQMPELCIRQSAQFGLDAIVRLPAGGQFTCRAYSGCSVNIRFDDGAVQKFIAAEAADGSSDTLFIRNAQRFLTALKNSKIVRVEAEFYQAGMQTMTFDTERFDPARLERPVT